MATRWPVDLMSDLCKFSDNKVIDSNLRCNGQRNSHEIIVKFGLKTVVKAPVDWIIVYCQLFMAVSFYF